MDDDIKARLLLIAWLFSTWLHIGLVIFIPDLIWKCISGFWIGVGVVNIYGLLTK